MRRNENTVKRDLFEGNIVPCLIALSWPVLISQCLNVFGPIIDLIWVGKLGSDAVAGVGIAGIISMVAMVAMYGFVSGVRALIARLMGTNDTKNANHAALQAYVMSLSLYVIIAIIGILFAEVILNFFRLEAEVVTEGAAYLRIMFIGAIFQSLWLISESIMQASGDTLTPMRIAVFVRLLHLGLCPILIFGWWIFPVLGVRGAAVSNAVSMGLGLALSLWVLFSGRTRVRLTLNKYHFDLNIIWRMVKVGLPNLFMHIQHHIFILMLLKLITPFGTVAVVAHAIWFRTDTIIIILGMSVGIGAGVMAAQNLGANQPERARKIGWTGAFITLLLMLVTLVIVMVWAEAIAGIFNNELDVVKITSSFLRIAATSYLAAGLNNIFMVFLITTGNTLAALLLEMAHTWCVQLPLAFLLTRYTDMGLYGMRWGMVIGLLVAGVIFTLYFWKGNWASKEV
jgi:putative MATE family efflux protein